MVAKNTVVKGSAMWVPKIFTSPKPDRKLTMSMAKVDTPKGAPETTSRLRPAMNPQRTPSSAPLSELQEITTRSVRSGLTPAIVK